MSKPNPFLDFIRSAGKPENTLLIFDVDLAIQPSMSTVTTQDQRDQMRQLYDITHGGVVFFTGRTHQSVEETFGLPYAGVTEHGCVARFALGHGIVYVAPNIDVAKMGQIAKDKIYEHGLMRIAETPETIRQSEDLAVFVEMKNTSMALVHTLKHSDDIDANHNHLTVTRSILEPIAARIIEDMGLSATHKVKTGGDAVEIVPVGPSPESYKALEQHMSGKLARSIEKQGVAKDTYVPIFKSLFDNDRQLLVTGDSAPDLDAGKVAKNSIYVSNNIDVEQHYQNLFVPQKDAETKDEYNHRMAEGKKHFNAVTSAIKGNIDHHTMTWPLIGNTVDVLRDSAPKVKPPLPSAGGMAPHLGSLN